MPIRRGFTLVEVMIALVIMLVVAGAVHSLFVSTMRLTRTQSLQVALQSNLRAGALVISNELRELSAVAGGSGAQNDIVRIGPTAVTYRAMRGVGFLCQASTATSIRIARNEFSGHRDPQAGRDSAYVFVAGAPGEAAGPWFPLAITSVSTGGGCPGGRGPGITLTFPYAAEVAGLELGTPVRIVEVMELRLYHSDGAAWLGARSVSTGEAIQPVVGPLANGRGLSLEYLSELGSPTSDPSSVTSVRVTLRGTADRAETGGMEEELVAQVALRNALP